ncbi:MAG TPA: sulfatase-like hydrolase/transferase [Clostridiales bacterium]|nr:sulfatase-like hydrolase/transferase [Clostridiales bacterium]
MLRQANKAFKNNNDKEHKSFLESHFTVLGKHQILVRIICSVLMVLVLEMLSRRSIPEGLGFIAANPLMFLFNTLIVLLTLSLSMMFSKRNFMMLLIGVIWIGLGITNFVIQCFRLTPLTFMDFYVLKSVSSIFRMYVDSIRMVLLAISLALLLGSMFVLWRRAKRYQKQIRIPALVIGISGLSMLMLSSFAVRVSALSDDFTNLPDAYADYGFAYCFSNSVIDRGIKEPDDYSEARMGQLLNKINSGSDQFTTDSGALATATEPYEGTIQLPGVSDASQNLGADAGQNTDPASEKQPNIIMLQLESFFDANHLVNYSFSEDPVPNFTKLKQSYSSGYLKVPVYGAGTINTEFEILSGMSIDFFGTSEYPYRTILQSTTAESICYNLAALGYRSYVIHNNTGIFYNRNIIFPKLGFDNFVSLEYMNDVEYTPTGWAKDNVLAGQILSALENDTDKDFIYTITVQSHGKYQEVPTEENQIKASSKLPDTSEAFLNQVEYYVNELHQTDAFIGDLLATLSTYEEPTVVVMFGDHQPPLDFDETDLANHNKFQTEYVVWSNYPMDNKKLDLSAYQLSAYVMSRVGYDNGLLTKFHQRCADSPNYKEELLLLQYDMLYGKQFVFHGVNPYQETAMKMGIKDPMVTAMEPGVDVLYIYGENFTPWSVVRIDENAKDTTFINSNTLSIPYEEFENPTVVVAQEAEGSTILSQSQPWTK